MKRELNLDITPAVERALSAMLVLLHHYGSRRGVPAKSLALKLWPNSPGWTANRDAAMRQNGKGPTYAATNMIVRLQRMGLAEPAEAGYRLTGRGVLQSIDAKQKQDEKAARIAARRKL